MKYLIKTTLDVDYTKKVAKKVSAMYKQWGLHVNFDIEFHPMDVSKDALYALGSVWTILKTHSWWSLSKTVLKLLYREPYDGLCVFIDGKKAPTKVTDSLRGLHTPYINGTGLMEVYSHPNTWVRAKKGWNGYHYNLTHKKNSEFSQDVYVLAHEVGHNLDYRLGKNRLHHEIKKNNFTGYLEKITKEIIDKNNKKGIIVTKGTHKKLGTWTRTQKFGVNGVCRYPSGRVVNAIKDGICPSGSVSIYEYFGMKGHNGIDFASPVGWRLYMNALNLDDPKMTWTIYNRKSKTYGNKVIAISDKPIFFKELPKEVNPADVEYYKTDDGWEIHVAMIYLHVGKFKVKEGRKVRHGDVIALTGNSGLSTGPHTHEAMKFTDPQGFALGKKNGYNGAFNHAPFHRL